MNKMKKYIKLYEDWKSDLSENQDMYMSLNSSVSKEESFETDLEDGKYKGYMKGWKIFVDDKEYTCIYRGIRGKAPITCTVLDGVLTFKLDR